MKQIGLLFTVLLLLLFAASGFGQVKKHHSKKHQIVQSEPLTKVVDTVPLAANPMVTPVESSSSGMSTGLIIALVLGGIFVFTFLVVLANNNDKGSGFYKIYTPNGLQLIKKLEEMRDNNLSFPYGGELGVYEQMFGKIESPGNERITTLGKLIGLDGWDTAPEGSLLQIAGDYFYIYLTSDLTQRYSYQHYKLAGIGESEVMAKYNLNIHSDEFIYLCTKNVDWYEEKTITTSYNYGGLQYRFNLGHGLSYRMGNLSVAPNTTERFINIDTGTFYITNKRVIFVGTVKGVNKTIDLGNILELSIFRNGILIGKPNGKKPLLQFREYIKQPNKPPDKRDDLNQIVIVLNRVIQKNQNLFLNEAGEIEESPS